jgi:sulfatase maturation enzyme AslB (radical SAM superfamily)
MGLGFFKEANDEIERNSTNKEIEFNLTLLVTEDCNLRCRYCFEKNNRPTKMNFEVAKRAIDKYLTREEGPAAVSIDFCGGEPLLEFEMIKNVFEYTVSGSWKKRFRFSLGTNGTIMTEEMKQWFIRHPCFQISISLDGTKEVHDYNRSGSYNTLIKNIDFFKQYDQPVKMTISSFTIPRLADSIIHIHELGMKPEANVVFEDVWGSTEEKSKLLDIYAKELDELVNYYLKNPELNVPRLLSHRIDLLGSGYEYGLEEKYCGAGKYMSAVMPDGKEYPCHRFSPLGSKTPIQNMDPGQKIIGPTKCIECGIRRLCHSCLGANLEICGSVNIRTVAHCEFLKLEVLASAKIAAKRLELLADSFFSETQEKLDEKLSTKALQMKEFSRAILWVQENVHL